MDKDNYFIKKGYKSRKVNHTLSVSSDDLYWSENRLFLSNFYQSGVYKYARILIKRYKLTNVIDIGCGPAVKLMKLIYPICADVTGVDQQEAIDFCKKHYKAGNFLVDNLEMPKLHLGRFDCIICADVIEHLVDPDAILKYIRELSNDNSVIIISTPERDILRGKDCMTSPKPEHVREWNYTEFRAYLESRGFEIKEQKVIPFMGFSFDKRVRNIRKELKQKTGTLNSTQLVLCKIK